MTERTHNAKYKRNRKTVLDKARREGLTHCPGYGNQHCGRELDWNTSRTPSSVEADHILPVRFGGGDGVDNLTPLCRECNQKKGDGTRVLPSYQDTPAFPVSREW